MTDLLCQIRHALPDGLPAKLGVAVSGGSDSVALLLLLQHLTETLDTTLSCVTVDHGLRAESAKEAAWVARLCSERAIDHDTLVWQGWDGVGNTQNAARLARYGLMAEWAKRRGIGVIALGHTLDDQAETVLMRLARGAGVDGLSAMAAVRHQDGIEWLRPLLAAGRAELREFLHREGASWQDDPSNEDIRFDRIKVRKALEHLEPLGITAEKLAKVSDNMRSARDALERQTAAVAGEIVTIRSGALVIGWTAMANLPEEIRRRLIVAALQWVSDSAYAPRSRSVSQTVAALQSNFAATLDGCLLKRIKDSLWVMREPSAVQDLRVPVAELWDGRWRLSGPDRGGTLQVGPLGVKGLEECPNWRETGLPRELVIASPAVWNADALRAAPLAAKSEGWQAVLEKGSSSFFEVPFAH